VMPSRWAPSRSVVSKTWKSSVCICRPSARLLAKQKTPRVIAEGLRVGVEPVPTR
jgi:hypothetical protein